MSKNRANSNSFMTECGYQTSSKVVKNLIKQDGLQSFEVIRIRHFETGKEAFEYEYKFLTKVDAMNNEKFLNQSNGKKTFTTLGRKSKLSSDSLAKIGKANRGKIWWTDGVNCKWQKDSPGINWIAGRAHKMKEHLQSISSSCKGMQNWNNGIVNVKSKFKPDGDNWELGVLMTEESRLKRGANRGKIWWNDGSISILSKMCPGDGWSKGRIIHQS